MVYKVALRQTEEGFSVQCPGLPGCWSQGATESEALENIQSAIQVGGSTVTVDTPPANCQPDEIKGGSIRGLLPVRNETQSHCNCWQVGA